MCHGKYSITQLQYSRSVDIEDAFQKIDPLAPLLFPSLSSQSPPNPIKSNPQSEKILQYANAKSMSNLRHQVVPGILR
jgi:hypothetical protein